MYVIEKEESEEERVREVREKGKRMEEEWKKGHGGARSRCCIVRRFYMVTRVYPLKKQRKRLLICYSRKVAKTELYCER